MHEDLTERVADLFPDMRATLDRLVAIPSVSAAGYDSAPLRLSAAVCMEYLETAGLRNVQMLEIEEAHPAVFGELPGPAGSPTVLLYAHHDVQPSGPLEEWTTPPFEPIEQGGRLYGRGSSDDKAGIVVHLGALAAHAGKLPVGVKVFFEGEEEIGSKHLTDYLDEYGDLLAADVIVIADSGNVRTGQPSLTTSLRGLVDCHVEVRVLETAVHSGWGGVFPDALMALSRLLATLHDEEGNVAVPGRHVSTSAYELTEEDLRDELGVVHGVEAIGRGSIAARVWNQPSISILAIDAPPLAEAINQLVPVARAKVSMRIAPGDDAPAALAALAKHLEDHAPWGASVTITPGGTGQAFALDSSGSAYEAFRSGFETAWGVEPVEIGVGGSIPFVAAFSERYPNASILLTGAGDHISGPHAPNESVDLGELQRSILAEAIALRLLAG